jgi:GDP-4-dehydro-6-deoxy-D-mannose reductase
VAGHLAGALQGTPGLYLAGADLRPGDDARFGEWHAVNLTDDSATRALLAATAPSVIYHLVGVLSGAEEAIAASNVLTTRHLLNGARSLPGVRIVLLGSAAEYGAVPLTEQPVVESFEGRPTTPYGRAKSEVTALARWAASEFGQQVMVARPFNVLGPGISQALVAGALIARLRAALAAPAPRQITVGRTDAVRDFVAVQDVAQGLMRIAERGVPGACYNLCTGEGHSIGEVLEGLLLEAGAPISVVQDPGLLRPGDVDQMIGSRALAETALGWRPRLTFRESLRAAWTATAPPA